jgi:hypothetical protein
LGTTLLGHLMSEAFVLITFSLGHNFTWAFDEFELSMCILLTVVVPLLYRVHFRTAFTLTIFDVMCLIAFMLDSKKLVLKFCSV